MTTTSAPRRNALGLAALKPLGAQLVDALFSCFPRKWLALLHSSPARLVLEPQGEALTAWEEGGEAGRRSVGGVLEGRAKLTVDASAYHIVLRLPADQALHKELALPLEAEAELRRTVGYQIPRETPFALQQVYYDALVVERSSDKRRLKARFVLAPRALVDDWLERLEQAGLSPAVVESAAVPGSNLLPPERRPRHGAGGGRLQWILLILAFMVVVAAAALPLWQKRDTSAALSLMLEEAQGKSETVTNLRAELEDIQQALSYFSGRHATSGQVLLLLNEMTRILPDGTWLSAFDFDQGEVRIQGESKDAAALIGLIEESKLYTDVSFQAPVTRNPTTGSDRFNITARVAELEGGEAAP